MSELDNIQQGIYGLKNIDVCIDFKNGVFDTFIRRTDVDNLIRDIRKIKEEALRNEMERDKK